MNVAAFKVSNSACCNMDATAPIPFPDIIYRSVRIHTGVGHRRCALDIESCTMIVHDVAMDIAADKVNHAVDINIDATGLQAARARSIGALEDFFKMQAHISSHAVVAVVRISSHAVVLVVAVLIDIAAFKVSHCVGCDKNAAAL